MLLLDLRTVCVLQVAESLLPPEIEFKQIACSSDGRLLVDVGSCQLYDMIDGPLKRLGPAAAANMRFQAFLLKDSICVLSQGQHVYAIDVSKGTTIGKVKQSISRLRETSKIFVFADKRS